MGLGTAYIHGFKWALKRDYQFIFEMDADFSHDPNDLIRLYNANAIEGGELIYWLSICEWGKYCKLANDATTHVLFCIQICKDDYWHANT